MSLESIPKLILLTLAIIAIIVLTALYNINQFQTESLEMDIMFNKILYSPDGISYTDTISERTYLGIINPNNINESRLNKAIAYPKDKTYSANISLIGQGFVKTDYIQKDWFIRFAPLARAKTQGIGGYDYVKKELPITYLSGDEFIRGRLIIEIIKVRR